MNRKGRDEYAGGDSLWCKQHLSMWVVFDTLMFEHAFLTGLSINL